MQKEPVNKAMELIVMQSMFTIWSVDKEGEIFSSAFFRLETFSLTCCIELFLDRFMEKVAQQMAELKLLAEGKTKQIFDLSHEQPNNVLVRSKDSLTAFNAKRKDEVEGKSTSANRTTCHVFQLLSTCGKYRRRFLTSPGPLCSYAHLIFFHCKSIFQVFLLISSAVAQDKMNSSPKIAPWYRLNGSQDESLPAPF